MLPVQTKIRRQMVFKFVTTLLAPLPNMSTKSVAHLKKVESAVQILQTTTGIKVSMGSTQWCFTIVHLPPWN
jgi:hypothetical protein